MARCVQCGKRARASDACLWCGKRPMCLNCKCDCRRWLDAETVVQRIGHLFEKSASPTTEKK